MILFPPEVTADRVASSWGLRGRSDTAPLRSFQRLLAIFDVPWNGEEALWPRPSFPHGLLDDMTLGMSRGDLRLSFPACVRWAGNELRCLVSWLWISHWRSLDACAEAQPFLEASI